MMEPGNHVLWTGVDVVEGAAELVRILVDVGTAIHGTVETESNTVGLVIVRRGPVWAQPLWSIPRLWAIVVTSGKDMMDTEWHHVVDTSLTTIEHHLLHRGNQSLIVREGLTQPLIGNLLRRKIGVPSQTAEGIPVGLCEVMSAPIHIVTDIGNTCHRLQTGGLHE